MMKQLLLSLLFIGNVFAQQGGMWIPSLLKGMNEQEMKTLGMKISAEEIYNVNHSSLKDAVPHFDGGCTAEVISPKGLILTNHHCGYGEIQAHSSLENDYLSNGFWAKSLEEELPNEGLTVTFIVRIEDVTQQVLSQTKGLSESEKQQQIQRNISALVNSSPKEKWQENRVKSFYNGNQFLLFVVENFKDVRLVGAPPSSIGKFGSDTDNWVWPRHTGDFSLFRIYADKNNHPASYSPDNVPYRPKHFFPISLKGIHSNDFTMVMGYPGRTNEYLPAVAVEQIVKVLNPAKIEIREAALKAQDRFMRNDPSIKIQYASKYARIANYWKKWIGETQGLQRSNAIALKKEKEATFLQQVKAHNRQAEYGDLLSNFEFLYQKIEPFALAHDVFSEVALRNVELLTIGYRLLQLEQVYDDKGEEAFSARKAQLLQQLKGIFKDYNKDVDKAVFEQLISLYAKKTPPQFLPDLFKNNFNASSLADNVYQYSALTSWQGINSLLNGSAEEIFQRLHNDVGFQVIQTMSREYRENVAPTYQHLQEQIQSLQNTYMKAILEFSSPKDRIFPDANSTLRVTYGKVKGYAPRDAVYYEPISYLEGVMEKYIPGDYEFDVPEKLRKLYENKDYGIYGVNGKMPVCFIATNHTTGGNSGSPALDADGNLIGLNFDRVWEGTMSDIYYDPNICRNIMVDIRYVLFIIDKFADAPHLINEMQLITPKSKK